MSDPPDLGALPSRALHDRLTGLRPRLERLWSRPGSLREDAGPLLRGWIWLTAREGPRLATGAMAAFRADSVGDDFARFRRHQDALLSELEINVTRLEDGARLRGDVPGEILRWLFALHRWMGAMDASARALNRHAHLALTRGLASRATLGPAALVDPGHQVALAGVDALLDEAAQETQQLARRRQLLTAARRLLLDAEATAGEATAPEQGDAPFAARRAIVAQELHQLARIEAAGIDPVRDLRQQLAQRAGRGQTSETATACAAQAYLGAEGPDVSEAAAALLARLPESSTHERLLPGSVEAAIERGYRRAREANAQALETAGLSDALALRRQRQHVGEDAHLALVRMALGVDGVFDVGGGLEREQVDIEAPTTRVVPFPTPELELHPVRDARDVRDAIIEDPRLLLYHLASRRLLHRRFVHREVTRRRGRGARAAVRFYLLDGSSSMGGHRARMRDAILVAELASLVSRLERPGGRVRSLLYYRFFNSAAEITRRVASVPEALEAIEEVLGAMRTGQTDIEGALLDSIATIARNRDDDVELARAQIVLVTDGAAPLDPPLILEAQRALDVPVRVSVILLGEPSPTLRALAAEQRAAGLRVLYHHVDDAALDAWERGEAGGAWPSFAVASGGLEAPEGCLEELSRSLAAAPDDDDPEALLAGLREVGLDEGALAEGVRARVELRRRDRAALARRFDRLFPAPPRAPESLEDPSDVELTVVLDALTVVSEVLALGPADPEARRRDAIAILERLLREREMTPTRYLALLEAHSDHLAPALLTLRAQAGL